jgi:hypothetical protein
MFLSSHVVSIGMKQNYLNGLIKLILDENFIEYPLLFTRKSLENYS